MNRIATRVLSFLETRRTPDPRRQRVWLLMAAAVFLIGAVIAYRELELPRGIDWRPLAVAGLVGAPLTLLANSLEYAWIAACSGRTVGSMAAIRVSILAAAANILPLPGAVVVRTQALRRLGVRYRHGLGATLAAGVGWFGVAAAIGGIAALASSTGLAVVLLLGAVIGLGASGILVVALRRKASVRLILVLIAIEAVAVVVISFRYYLVLRALGFHPSVVQAVMLTLAAVLASIAGIFPSGLGLRELLGAGLAPLVGMGPAVGLVATALDRMVELAVSAPVGALIAFHYSEDGGVELNERVSG